MSDLNYLKRAERNIDRLLSKEQRTTADWVRNGSETLRRERGADTPTTLAEQAERAAQSAAKAEGMELALREVRYALDHAKEAQTRHEDETREALRRALSECESCCLDTEQDREWVLYQLMTALGHAPGESDTKQVVLGNGNGQGAFGLGPTFAVAADIARREWRSAIGRKLPKRIRLCERDMGTWSYVIEEAPFRSWKALAATATDHDA